MLVEGFLKLFENIKGFLIIAKFLKLKIFLIENLKNVSKKEIFLK
jgi:hypothetical protein